MALMETGRSRSVVASGNFNGEQLIQSRYGLPAAPWWDHNFLTIDIQFLGCFIRFQTREINDASTDPVPPTRHLDLTAWTGPGLGFGDGDTAEVTHDFDSTDSTTWNWSENLSTGTWEISTSDILEYIEENDTGDYPTYGGAKVYDPPTERKAVFKDGLQVGKLLTATASVAGMSVSASVIIDEARVRYFTDYPLVINVTAEGRGKACSDIGVVNAQIEFDGTPATLTGTLAHIGADHSVSANPGEGGAGARVAAACGLDAKKTKLDAAFYPRRDATVNIGVRAMEDAYPGSVNLRIDKKLTDMAAIQSVSHGSTLTIQQEKHALAGSYFERAGGAGYQLDRIGQDTPLNASGFRPNNLTAIQPTGVFKDERTPLRMWVDASWINNQGEQPDDWRFLLRGRPFSSFTLIQASEMTVTSTLASGTGATDLTINLPTGTTAAGLQGSSFSGASLRGYRYLRLRMKASTNETVTITIGSKSWTQDKNGASLALTTSYQNFDIDLCSPTNATGDTDSTDSFFPLPTSDGDYWGVSAAASIIIGSISGGVTVDVESVKVVRDSYSRATFLQPFPMEWIAAGDTSEYPVRMIDGDTDGRRSHEAIHFYRTGSTYVSRTLTEIIASINGAAAAYPSDGFTATASGGYPDILHDNDLPACFAWGGGMLYQSGAWSYGFDQSVAASLTVKAQYLWDSIDWLPMWGDGLFYTAGAYADSGVFAAGKILRGQAVGLVFDESSLPASGVTVNIDGGAKGTGATGTNGSYQTGLPYPKGGVTADVTAQQGDPPLPTLSVQFPARKRKRACFAIVTTNPATALCLVADSPRGWLHVGVNSRVRTYHINSLAILMESDEYANVDTWKKLRLCERYARLLMLGLDSPNTWRVYYSESGGITGTEVLTLTADSAALAVNSAQGVVTLFYEAGAGVYVRQSEDGGTTWGSAVAVDYLGSQLDATLMDATQDDRLNGAIFIAVDDGVAVAVLKSETIGADFSLALT